MAARRQRYRNLSPVEPSASGAAAWFDGNYTSNLESWLFANERWDDEKVAQMLFELMQWTAIGHLSWVAFPAQGYRIPDYLTLVIMDETSDTEEDGRASTASASTSSSERPFG